MRSFARLTAAVLLSLGFLIAGAFSVRVAIADYCLRRETLADTERAISINPQDAALYFRLGLLESADDNRRASEAFERALAVNPASGPAWIELGLRHEVAGNYRLAEQCLLRAAEEDKQYLPRWSLANYYFRRNDVPQFWAWAKQAADILDGDPRPLFRLCGTVAEDGHLIDRLRITRPDLRASYVSYLIDQNRLDVIVEPSQRLLEVVRAGDVETLLSICDRLLGSQRYEEALDIWNGLADARRISFARISTGDRNVVTNAEFAVSPTSRGFDWRPYATNGVSVASEDNPTGLRITFSGRQPEHCEPLMQFMPVQPNTSYTLRYRYGTSRIPLRSGLRWKIVAGTTATLADGESLSSDGISEGQMSFQTPPGGRLVRLILAYDRGSGTTRIEGSLALHKVELLRAR